MPMLVKTVKIGIHKEVHAVKQQAILATQALYNQTIAFYIEFFVGHIAVLDAKKEARRKNGTPYERSWTNQELLTFAEMHTLDTKAHPHPLQPLIENLPSVRTMPVSLRRAAINHAIGKVKSWYSLLKLWEATDRKKRPPQLGQPNEPITFYADMVEYPDVDDVDLEVQRQVRHDFIAVKLFYEGQWQLVPLPVTFHRQAQDALTKSQAESVRIYEATIKARKAPKEAWTDAERAAVRPREWCAMSLALYAKRDKQYPGGLRFAFHVPFEKWVDAPQKAKEQFAADPGMSVVTVDLGVNRLAVMGAFRSDKLTATKFIHGGKVNHHRHQLLNVIANKRSQSGRLQANAQDNVELWGKVRHIDENAARQVARQIVDFALAHEAKVIVLEYLRRYRPPKERMSRSGRKNHKRAYWLRGQIMKWVRDLAFREGILTVERNPAYTSQMCPHCHTQGNRTGPHFACQNPSHLYHADADFVGMMNLYRKWNGSFVYPRKKNRADEPKPVQAYA
ncbi:MAG: transposase [Firmicutes bacterium]|nr:transposase [Bacillota bacterium]